MDKKELLEDVLSLRAFLWDKPWNMKPKTPEELIEARLWYEFIGDLPATAVQKVLRDMSITGKTWPPKPGELRVAAISMMQEDAPPDAFEAWSQLQENRAAIYSGTAGTDEHKELHDVLKFVIKKLGNNRAQELTTNGDRTMFIDLYEKERAAWILSNYGFDQ